MARVEGLEVKISSNTEEFDQAMKKLDRSLSQTKSDARLLKNELKFKGTSLDSINKSIATTQRQLTLTKQKQAELNAEMKRMEDAGKIDTRKYTTLHNKLNTVTGDANRLEAELEDLNQQKITLSTQNAENALTRLQTKVAATSAKMADAGEKFQNAGSKISGVGQSMLGITGAVAAAGVAVTNFGADMQDTEQATNAVFGGAITKQIQQFGDTASASLGLSKQAAMQATTSYGNMWTSMGLGKQKSAELSMQMVQLAADASSFTGVPVDQAVQAMTGALSGETEALKSLGVVMTDTQVQQYAQANGFKGSWQQADNLTKAQYRLKYIQSQLKNANGDFSRSNDSLQNTLKTAKAEVSNLAASIGTALIPVIQPIIAKFNEWVQKLNEMTPAQQRMVAGMALLAASIGPVLIVVGKMSTGLGSLLKVGSFLGTTVFPALVGAIGSLSAPVVAIGAGIAALVAAFAAVYNKCEAFRNAVNAVVSVMAGILKDTIKLIADSIKAFLTPIVKTLSDTWKKDLQPALEKVSNVILKQVVPAVKNVWNWFKANLFPIVTKIAGFIGGQFAARFRDIINIFKKVCSIIGDLVNWMVKLWNKFKQTSFAKNLANAFKSVGDWIKKASSSVSSFINSFVNMVNKIKNKATEMVNWVKKKADAVANAFNIFDAGGFGNVTSQYQMAVEGVNPANYGGAGDINVYNTFTLNNNGDNISAATFQEYGETIVDIIDKEFYKKGRV